LKHQETIATAESVATAEAGAEHELNRRQFLEHASLTSAALLLAPSLTLGGSDSKRHTASARRARHAAFQSLAPGDVVAQGWLRLYLQKQAQQLGSHLPEVSWPFGGAYWSGEENPPEANANFGAWWAWEQKGYFLDGALRCALALQDEKLLQRPLAAVRYTLDHVQPDGYLGPAFAKNGTDKEGSVRNFRWPHAVFFRALAAHGEATQDPRVATALQRHYLAEEHRASYGGPSRDVTNVEGMLWAYERTGDERLLVMAQKSWDDFIRNTPAGDWDSGDLNPDRVFANTYIHAHGVTYIEKAKLPAILYMHTGNSEYLRFALAAQERIFSRHMLIDGIPSTTEEYRETTALHGHETCDISDHTWSWGYLLMATGDGIWADRIERACFNAGFGAIKKDWKAVQYFSCPNQIIATSDSTVHFGRHIEGRVAYRPNPGHVVACCGGNAHRFFPNYVIRMWMADADHGLAAVLYGASTVRAEVGRGRERIEIKQETNYPFEEATNFTIDCKNPATFPLSFRIPGWCKTPTLELNGMPLALPPVHNGFTRLQRTFHPGDRLTLTLPMHTTLTYWPDDALGFERGPLVYALPVKEEWTPVVNPKWSTAEFPEWNATPASAWNYAVAVKESALLGQVEVQRKPVPDDPWMEPPVSLTVPLMKIPGWELRTHPEQPNRKHTPALPDLDALEQQLSTGEGTADIERVALIPYGATHLRLTIFPKVWVP
jgi:hypothetical protein